jgi:simple sugar transport system permease protein
MGLAAALGGAAWIVLPALLKARLNVNEIISTLLLNYVAFNLLLHLLYGPWTDPVSSFPHSRLYDDSERFARLGWHDLNASVLLAVLLVAGGIWLAFFSRFGFLLNALNANPDMARAAGVNVTRLMLVAALGSGMLAGLAGFTVTTGIDARLTQSFFVGYLFSGILIAFLARNNPLGVVFFALLVAILMVAGQSLQVFYRIPFSMVQVIQTIIVICVAASGFFIRYRIRLVT